MEPKAKIDAAWRPQPGIINEVMIKQAISKMVEADIPGFNIDEEEGYEFQEISQLHLEHLDILRIDHLWIMPALTVLKLTGNLIKKIENLETLVHLTDLNLSFNEIETIENLDELTKLRQLSLYSNLITKIQNLENLKNLKILTIGDNKIEDKECVLLLRKLNLFSLNMAKNPCVQEGGFRKYIAAYIPNLKFYEYKKITDEEREAGREKYLKNLEVLERTEAETDKEAKIAAAQAEKEELYDQAFVKGLDQHQLYEAMFKDDTTGNALLLIGDEVVDIFNKFKEEIIKATTEIFNRGLVQLNIRKKEIEMFYRGTQDAIVRSQAMQREIIEKFIESKANISFEIHSKWETLTKGTGDEISRKTIEDKLRVAYLLCTSVKKELLTMELTLSEQLKELFSLFERSLGDMVNSFIESAQGQFTNMREHESTFSEQIGDQASRFLTQLTIRNEDLSSLPPPLRPIMVDKEAVNSAIASSHDIHLQVIDNREDQLISESRTWYQKLCSDYEQEEIVRFRRRIYELTSFLEMQASDFQLYQTMIDDDLLILGE